MAKICKKNNCFFYIKMTLIYTDRFLNNFSSTEGVVFKNWALHLYSSDSSRYAANTRAQSSD